MERSCSNACEDILKYPQLFPIANAADCIHDLKI